VRITEAKQTQPLVAKVEAQLTNVNLPNLLTLARILLIPVFMLLFSNPTPDRSLAAACVFTIAAVTDLLDGYLARRRSQVTRVGRLMDPIADKLLVISGLVLLVQFQRVAAIVAILIIAREIAVTGVRAIAAAEGIAIPVETTGKYKMTAQVVAIVLLIVEDAVMLPWDVHVLGTVSLYIALILGLVSGGRYLIFFWRQVSINSL
jgi:CDP-diacylglycerol--glycerol-3-phosphate 3-phosphatidyltransferase